MLYIIVNFSWTNADYNMQIIATISSLLWLELALVRVKTT